MSRLVGDSSSLTVDLPNQMAYDSGGNFLSQFDFSAIEELDPSMADGHVVIYDREVPFELRIQDSESGSQEIGTLEPIKAKILVMGEETNPYHTRLEITSENDLFFHYTHSVDEPTFRNMQEGQKLMIEFPDYMNILIKMLNSCIKEPQSFLAVFVMQKNGQGRLDFIQNMEYKFVELLSCNFQQSPEDVVREHISFRYNAIKSKAALMRARLQDVNSLIKIKNPSLLLQLQKSAQQINLSRTILKK